MKKLFLVVIWLLLMVAQANAATYVDGVEQGVTGTGTGDMTKAVYDTDSNNVVDKATALNANGANCNAGNYPLGVDASGAVENCTAVPSFSATDISGATADTTPATTSEVALNQGGSLIKSTLAEMFTAMGGDGKQPLLSTVGADLIFAAPTELTLSSNTDGNITATQVLHTVDTFEDAATGALDTIAAGTDGQVLYLRAAHTDRTVVLDETDNIIIPYGSTLSLDTTSLWIKLIYDAGLSKWVVVSGLPDSINFSLLDMRSGTSYIGSLTPVIGDADDFDDNFTGGNLYGGTYIVNAAGTIVLPEPAAGMNFTIVLEAAAATVIDPLGTGTADTIVMNGLAAAADENITSSTIGAICVFQYRAANSWMATCKSFVEATPP